MRVDELPAPVHGADAVGVAVGGQPELAVPGGDGAGQRAQVAMAIGSGWMPPKPGFISPRISNTSQPVPCRMPLICPRPGAEHRVDDHLLRIVGDGVEVDQRAQVVVVGRGRVEALNQAAQARACS